MKKLACKDINPSTTCNYEATGENSEEVAEKMLAHAKVTHPDDIESMNLPDSDIEKNFEAKVHE